MRAPKLLVLPALMMASAASGQPCSTTISPAYPAPAFGSFCKVATFNGPAGPEIWTAGFQLRLPGDHQTYICVRWTPAGFEPVVAGGSIGQAVVLIDAGDGGPPVAYLTDGQGLWRVENDVPVSIESPPGGPRVLAGRPASLPGDPFEVLAGGGHGGLFGWDGTAWVAIGDLAGESVTAVLHDGERLVVAAESGAIYQWDGTAWQLIGTADGMIQSLVFDSVITEGLVAAGSFTSIDGVAATAVAALDNKGWRELGAGVGGFARDAVVSYAGGEPRLVVAGPYLPGMASTSLVAWDGMAWQEIPGHGGMDLTTDLASIELAGEPVLIQANDREIVDAGPFSIWDGHDWALGTRGIGGDSGSLSETVGAIRGPSPDGTESWVYFGGDMDWSGGQQTGPIAAFDGTSFRGLNLPSMESSQHVRGIGVTTAPFGVWASGWLCPTVSADPEWTLMRWDGAAWTVEIDGLTTLPTEFAVLDDVLYGMGAASGQVTLDRWTGTAWESAGVTDGTWTWRLIAGGPAAGFQLAAVISSSSLNSKVLFWNDGAWSAPAESLNGIVLSLHVHEGALHVGGANLSTAEGNRAPLVRWTGTEWIDVVPSETWGLVGGLASWQGQYGSQLLATARVINGGAPIGIDLLAQTATGWTRLARNIDNSDGSHQFLGADLFMVPMESVGDEPESIALFGAFDHVGDVSAQGFTIIDACPLAAWGDLNGDGAIDSQDLIILLAAWGSCPAKGECPADLDGDGQVAFSDLLVLLSYFGS